jgi:hypothetical protein
MDPSTVAASLVTLLAPYLGKAAMEFAGEAGKQAQTFVQERAKALWERLRLAFADDAHSAETLDRFASDPDTHKEEVEARVADRLTRDKPLQDELATGLKEIKQAAPQIRVVQQMKEAEAVVGLKVRRMTRGTAEVTQVFDSAKNVTGAELDEI